MVEIKEFLKDKQKIILVLSSFLLGVLLLELGSYNFDKFQHLVFSRHYAKESVFALVDWQTGMGLNVAEYPPLFHQLIALTSNLFSLETSGIILTAFSWVFLSYNAAKFGLEYFEYSEDFFWIFYLLIFVNAGLLKVILVYGMNTTIAGFGMGFLASRLLLYSFKDNRWFNWILFALSFALTGFIHHFSFLVFSMFFVGLTLSHFDFTLDKVFRLSVSLGLVFFILLVGLTPFITSLFEESITPQTEIPHPSRNSLTSMDSNLRHKWFYSTYTFAFIGIFFPVLLILNGKDGRRLPLYIISLFFFILSLGRTTILPKIVLGPLEHWLTYDRFGLLSSFLLTFFTVHIAIDSFSDRFKDLKKIILVVVLIVVGINFLYNCSVYRRYHYRGLFEDDTSRMRETELVSSYLKEYGSEDYRFQTLGYQQRVSKLALKTDIPTTDTEYYQAREEPWIRNSGEETIDLFSFNNALKFMEKAEEYSVKYVITFENMYENAEYQPEHLLSSLDGWERVSTTRNYGRQIAFWENPDTPPLEDKEQLYDFSWGATPLVSLAVFILLFSMDKGVKKW